MKKKNQLIIPIIIIFIISSIIIIVSNVNKARQNTKTNLNVIKSSYATLSSNIQEYNQIRERYNILSQEFILETYKNNHEEYTRVLTEYNDVIEKIDLSIISINSRCNQLYSDQEVNKICNNYRQIYEKLINLYITDLNNYNDNLTKYNEYKNDDIELFTLLHTNYIDYNSDGIYEGRDTSEEN